jgi:hypothetical protein
MPLANTDSTKLETHMEEISTTADLGEMEILSTGLLLIFNRLVVTVMLTMELSSLKTRTSLRHLLDSPCLTLMLPKSTATLKSLATMVQLKASPLKT